LFSSYVSNFIQKFLAVYLLVKKKLDSFFFKVIFLKILFLRGQKILVLVNTYRLIKRITNSNRRTAVPFKTNRRTAVLKTNRRTGIAFNPTKKRLVTALKRRHKKCLFKQVLSSKIFSAIRQKSPALREQGLFSAQRVNFLAFNLKLEQFLAKSLSFPVEIRLKSIFSLQKTRVLKPKRPVTVLSLCRTIYKKTKNF
jgi:hypothetical protein